AENQLEEQIGQRPDITCEEDLPAEVDASIRCELTAGEADVVYGVTVTATDVSDGGMVNFQLKVDEEPMGCPAPPARFRIRRAPSIGSRAPAATWSARGRP